MTKKGMREPESLMSQGLTRIAIDKPTRAKLHELAGDMPVSRYLRGIAFGDIKPGGSPQAPLPGQERLVSSNTLPAIASSINSLISRLDAWFEPENKRSLKSDVIAADAWFWHQLGLEPTADNIREFKAWLGERKAKRSESAGDKQGDSQLGFEGELST
jgi:hypothetical protein